MKPKSEFPWLGRFAARSRGGSAIRETTERSWCHSEEAESMATVETRPCDSMISSRAPGSSAWILSDHSASSFVFFPSAAPTLSLTASRSVTSEKSSPSSAPCAAKIAASHSVTMASICPRWTRSALNRSSERLSTRAVSFSSRSSSCRRTYPKCVAILERTVAAFASMPGVTTSTALDAFEYRWECWRRAERSLASDARYCWTAMGSTDGRSSSTIRASFTLSCCSASAARRRSDSSSAASSSARCLLACSSASSAVSTSDIAASSSRDPGALLSFP
mmetsp:Transcript_62862/g.149794  ORF Transcript_62862/g.149794 Transcript_62862/m.149794 type:complete len:278 (-) Transcript_62862:160-993(-)